MSPNLLLSRNLCLRKQEVKNEYTHEELSEAAPKDPTLSLETNQAPAKPTHLSEFINKQA